MDHLSSCMRIGLRFTVHCSFITTRSGGEISLSDTLRYLGVHITADGRKFCCSLKNAKNHFIVHLTVFLAKSVSSRMKM